MGALDLQLRLQDRETDALIHRMNRGDRFARDLLFELILPVLLNIAISRLNKAHPLVRAEFDEIALINEASLRLLREQFQFENTNHFLARFSLQMRSVLVDQSRKRLSEKSGGDRIQASLDDLKLYTPALDTDLIALNEALDDLARRDRELAQVVELLYFADYSVEETADILRVSTATVKRRWRKAKSYLRNFLGDAEESRD